MDDIAARLRRIEDRQGVGDVLLDYYAAIDSLDDLDGIVACFTADAIFDVTPLGLSRLEGRAAIRTFFAGVFADTAYHAHHVSNFRILRVEGDHAIARCAIFARAIGRSGIDLSVHCWVDLECARTPQGWRIARFTEGSRLPLTGAVAALHESGAR